LQRSGKDLIDCLSEVTLKSHKNSEWESVRAALKTIWSKDRIDTLARRLGDYRQQLSLRILLLLNSHEVLRGEKLDLLEEKSKEIIEIVSINSSTLQSAIDEQHRSEKARQQGDHLDTERRHAETIAAILTTRDGASSTITGPGYSAYDSAPITGGSEERTRTTTHTDKPVQDVESPDGRLPTLKQVSSRISPRESLMLYTFGQSVHDGIPFKGLIRTHSNGYIETLQSVTSDEITSRAG
jgi:hypothetical protein